MGTLALFLFLSASASVFFTIRAITISTKILSSSSLANADFAQISTRDSVLWAIDTSNHLFRIVDSKLGGDLQILDKVKVREGVKNVGAAFDGSIWAVDLTGKLFRYKDGQCWSEVEMDENWLPATQFENTTGFMKKEGFPTPVQVAALNYNEALVTTDVGLVMYYRHERWEYLNNFHQRNASTDPALFYGLATWVAINDDGNKYIAKYDLNHPQIAKYVCNPDCDWETVLFTPNIWNGFHFDVYSANRSVRTVTTKTSKIVLKQGLVQTGDDNFYYGDEIICWGQENQQKSDVYYSAAITAKNLFYIKGDRTIVKET